MPKPKPVEGRSARAFVHRSHEDGTYTWKAAFYDDQGKRRTKSLGRHATRDEAKRALAAWEDGGRRRRQPQEQEQRRQAGTVGDLLDRWLAYQLERASLAERSKVSYSGAVARLELLRPIRTVRLDRPALDGWMEERIAANAAGTTLDLDLAVLRMAWRWAQRRGGAPPRALDLPPVPRRARRRRYNDRTPERDELVRVIQATDQLRLRATLHLLWATGARIASVASLRWDDIDEGAGTVTFRGTKTGDRSVPVGGEVFKTLRAWREEAPPGPRIIAVGVDGWKTTVRRHLEAVCAELGIPRFTSHGIRRLATTSMLEAGMDPATVASITGHSVEVMLRRYMVVRESRRREAVRRAGLGSLEAPGKVIELGRER